MYFSSSVLFEHLMFSKSHAICILFPMFLSLLADPRKEGEQNSNAHAAASVSQDDPFSRKPGDAEVCILLLLSPLRLSLVFALLPIFLSLMLSSLLLSPFHLPILTSSPSIFLFFEHPVTPLISVPPSSPHSQTQSPSSACLWSLCSLLILSQAHAFESISALRVYVPYTFSLLELTIII